LTPKALELLLALVENRERVLEKSELMERIWPDSFVEETNLTQNISTLRKALGESPQQHQYIITVPGRGYRFVAEITTGADDQADLLTRKLTRSRVIVDEITETAHTKGASRHPKLLAGLAKPLESRPAWLLLLGLLILAAAVVFSLSSRKKPE